MSINTSLKRSPFIFFGLVFAFSLLFSVLVEIAGPLAARFSLALPFAIPSGFNPITPIVMGCIPLLAACILVARERQPGSVSRFLKRTFDFKRIKHKIWYVPALLLNLLIYVIAYGVMLLLRLPLPEPHILWWTLPIFFFVFFIEGIGEEVGWTGYAVDPLQERWGALQAGILLGLVTGAWHIIPGLQAHQAIGYIMWQGLFDVAWRILGIWLYNNTGKSLFAVILFHDTYNVGYVLFPNTGSHYDPAIAFPVAVVMVIIVTFLWGANTLARYRYSSSRPFVKEHSIE